MGIRESYELVQEMGRYVMDRESLT